MTRMLCRPSWPKWYICGMPAARRQRSGRHEKHIVSLKRSAGVGGGRYVRQPARIRYERHSSRSWGASAFRGSYRGKRR